jgi:GDPmannose 4,6-dehydratase
LLGLDLGDVRLPLAGAGRADIFPSPAALVQRTKVYAHHMTVDYRETKGIFACCQILFNYESPRQGEYFVTRKVTPEMTEVPSRPGPLRLGNLEAKREWGHVRDHMKAMQLMLRQGEPDDFVSAPE